MPDIRRRIERTRQQKANTRFRELRSLVEAAGYVLDRVKGSHHIFVKGRSRITIFNHPGDISETLVERVLDELERVLVLEEAENAD